MLFCVLVSPSTGQQTLRRLVKEGIPCSYIFFNAVSYIMKEVWNTRMKEERERERERGRERERERMIRKGR